MIELDPSCDTLMVSEINFLIFTDESPAWDKFSSRGDVVFSICYFLNIFGWSLLRITSQVGVMWFLLIVTLLKYILFEVMIGYIFE